MSEKTWIIQGTISVMRAGWQTSTQIPTFAITHAAHACDSAGDALEIGRSIVDPWEAAERVSLVAYCEATGESGARTWKNDAWCILRKVDL